jgi:hypothetical protein
MLVIATGLDYSARRLTGTQVRAAGYTFVNRYLWFPGQRWPALTADEYRDMRANGVDVHAVYEQDTNDPAGGWDGGVRMAHQAVESARAVGLPRGTTIFMCADGWLTNHGIPVGTAMEFLDGARSVIDPAGYVIGAYGFADFVYAAQDGDHADRFWLCGAESGVRPGIHMYQWNNGRVYVDALDCDLNKQYLPMNAGGPGGGGGGGDDVSWYDKFKTPDGNAEYEAWQYLVWSNHYDNLIPGVVQMVNTQGQVLAAIAEDVSNNVQLTPEQLELLRTGVSADLSRGFNEMGAYLAERLGVGKDVVHEALRDFFRPAVNAQPDGEV